MVKGLRGQLVVAAVLIAALAGADVAFAQAYKCKDAKGSITYSDAPCLGQDASVVSTTGNTVDGSADRAKAARSESSASGSVGSPSGGGMTDQQRQDRIRELEIESKRMGNTSQQRTAAKREIEALKRGSGDQLTPTERERREDLYKDAGRAEQSTRQKAAREMKEQTDRYESPEYLRQQEIERINKGIVASCDPGGCNDTKGRRYHKGAGTTLIRAADRKVCTVAGTAINCN